LVDEIVVVDDRSTDATAAVATRAGALVVAAQFPPEAGAGKGAAMATALAVSKGDVIVFLDADVVDFSANFVLGLLGPIFSDRSISFVKATYRRSLGGVVGEGGRVTELTARPLLEALFPELAQFGQPLAGECAVRRALIDPLSLPTDYGIDVALLIDVARSAGFLALAEVDLDHRIHRNRPLRELAPQASSVIRAILTRAGVNVATPTVAHHAIAIFEDELSSVSTA
jgi:glucosyl-3-phosphoglycerate synthase